MSFIIETREERKPCVGTRSAPRGQHRAGFTLLELLIAVSVLMLTSLSLAYAFSSSQLASERTDRAVVVHTSLRTVYEDLADVPYGQVLSWNGVQVNRGDHNVTVSANQVQVGLIVVEFAVTDARTGAVLARLATYRSGDA
jgi:prepilin-type N-terminal cleavage/methylation domain-containing protein